MKKQNKKELLKNNKNAIICLVVGIVIGVVAMYIMWPDRITTLKDGSEVVASMKGKNITSDDLYQKYKEDGSIDTILEMIDTQILHDKYKLDDEATKWAKEQSESIYESYSNYYGMTKNDFLTQNGFETEKDFFARLESEYYYQHYYDEYVKNKISDDEINTFYNDSVFGPKDIYLFVNQEDSKSLESVITELKKGTSFDDIQSKFSNVNCMKYEGVTYKDAEKYSTDVIAATANLTKGKNSKVLQDSKYGNFVVYVVSEGKKEKLNDIKEDMLSIMVKNKQSSDETLYYKAFIELRNEYKVKISDTKLDKEYQDIVKKYK